MTHDTTRSSNPKPPSEKHNEFGEEIPDPTPMQPPLGYKRSLSLSEQIAQQVRIAHLKILEDSAIAETDEEADDFEVGDDYEPMSKWENDNVPTLGVLKKRAKEINDAIERRKLEVAIEMHKEKIAKTKAKTEPPPEAAETNDLE